jgi:hypothetical protein
VRVRDRTDFSCLAQQNTKMLLSFLGVMQKF